MGMLSNVNGFDVTCGPGRTKQSFKDEVNINKILAKFGKTGMIERVNAKAPFYGDVSVLTSYQESLAVVKSAEDLFRGMSSEVRAKFGNNPVGMIDFLADVKNIPEAVKLGMVVEVPKEVPSAGVIASADGKPS